MDLILWRHADAESGIPDEARGLTAEGRRQAARMAEWLRVRLPQPRIVLVSPARRAQETARALAEKFEVSAALGTMAAAQAVLEATGWPDAGGVIVAVGHQPTLGQAAMLALTGRALDASIEKGAIWWLARRSGTQETRLRAVIASDML